MSNCSLKRAPFTLCTQCDHLIKRFYHHAQTQGGRAKALSSLILACSASITPEYFLDVIYNKNLKKFNIFFPKPLHYQKSLPELCQVFPPLFIPACHPSVPPSPCRPFAGLLQVQPLGPSLWSPPSLTSQQASESTSAAG